MYLKSLKLTNYRKFSTEQNEIEFISSKLIKVDKKIENQNDKDIVENDIPNEEIAEIDVASDTTLIIGKNNAGKTTIITAMDTLINHGKFGINDFNYRYLQQYLKEYDINDTQINLPFIECVFTVELEENSDDRISNLIPFMLVEDVNNSELKICIRYEIADASFFKSEMEKLFSEETEGITFASFFELLNNTDFEINYYDKNAKKIDVDFKISNLMELQCIKANHLKSDHCLTEAFNKIIKYRYEHTFQNEKREVNKKLKEVNSDLSINISKNHTDIIQKVLERLISMERMGVQLSADITFDKLIRDLIKYEYIEDNANVPEDQFGLGYTNLVMIIAAIIDYIEKYPDSSFNSKINLISIEEPETYMHPQMQELFIKNINEAIRFLLSSKNKDVNSQIIITTHSSHILNSKIHSANTFNNICYLSENQFNAVAVNLNNQRIMPKENEDEESGGFRFLKKHIKYKVSELFFSDAAIFVEGFAEDIILPYYIEKREKLNRCYISIFNINGAHGFLYKRLVEALGIPVLIVTDLDIKRENEDEDESESIDNAKAKGTVPYVQIDCLNGKKTTNATIIDLKGDSDLTNISTFIEKDNLYLAYQGKINGYYATSFEEALILSNYDNEVINDILKELKPRIYTSIVGIKPDYKRNIDNSYKWQVKLSNCKGEFASKLLYQIVNEGLEEKIPQLPKYISDGLDWIEQKLGGK